MLSKERKLEIYTERLWRLALDIALQASMGGKERHGLAIVAEETRNISTKLYRLMDIEDNDSLRIAICDALFQLHGLALNGNIEMLRVFDDFAPYNTNNPKSNPVAVILEEICHVANDIRSLLGLAEIGVNLPQPELKHESTLSDVKLFLLQATVGGVPFVENTAYIQEIIAYIDGDEWFGIQDGFLNLRGEKVPAIDCYTRFGLEKPSPIDSEGRRSALIINTPWEKPSVKYAVPVDAFPLSFGFYSRFPEGQNVESRSKIFTNAYVRACWDTVDEEQMMFLNWKALAQS